MGVARRRWAWREGGGRGEKLVNVSSVLDAELIKREGECKGLDVRDDGKERIKVESKLLV